MKITKLRIENFLAITEAELNLADRGLLLVQGINSMDSSAASNGSGKSSIADALCWAIYGTTARGESGDAVVNRIAGRNTRVEVRLVEDSGVAYTIVRHRKHKTGKNSLHVFVDEGAGPRDLTKGTDKLTQGVADKVIGASLDVFTGSIYAGQESMPDLPAMNDKALKVLIEEAAGITALEEAYRIARENLSGAKTDYDLAKTAVGIIESTIAIRDQSLEAAIEGEKNWMVQRDDEVAALLREVSSRLIPGIKDLKRMLDAADAPGLTAQIAAIDQRLAQVSQEHAEFKRLQDVLNRAASDYGRASGQVVTAQQKVAADQAYLDAVRGSVGNPCQSCGRPMTPAEIATAEQKAIGALNASEAALTGAAHTEEDARRAAEEAQEAHDDFAAGMTDVSAETASRAALSAALAKADQIEREKIQLDQLARQKLAEIDQKKAAASPFAGQINLLRQQLDDDRQDLVKAQKQADLKFEKVALEGEVVKVFAPAGVRSRVLDEVTPYLNAQTGKYLSILSDGNLAAEWSTITRTAKGEAREKFVIDVTSTTAAESFKGLSGGEKRKVRVATALALQDLVATRATKPIDLFLGDEIDDALDASGLERLMIILEEKASERGTVMVISHRSLRDEIRQVIQVEKRADGTTAITEMTT